MLDERDLQAIAQIMDEKISASESRMKEEIGARMKEEISASESRMKEEISASESRMKEEISASESRMMVLMESYFEPKFNLLADGQALIREKMLPAEALSAAEDRIDVLEAVVRLHSGEIEKLKKAQ